MTPADLRCRGCSAPNAEVFLSLGPTPLANSLLTAEQLDRPEPCFPLDVCICHDCGLVQLTTSVPPEQLFRDYVYFSSYSDAWVEHARRLAERLIDERRLDGGSLVVEIASNDGYLLQHFVRRGIRVLGIDPASNVVPAAEKRGVRTLCEFFTRDLAMRLRAEGVRADVVLANNVLAHVPDPVAFLAGAALLLKPGGRVEIEAPYLADLVEHLEFDTIYHEHLCYFSLHALGAIFARAGLVLCDARRLPTHGGSIHLSACAASDASEPNAHPSPTVAELLAAEQRAGLTTAPRFREFAARVETLAVSLRTKLTELKRGGATLAAYGAAAKGSTLLNYARVDRALLDFVVDRSPAKQGRYMPGSHLPILPAEALLERRPDYTVLLAWNFADEILEQQKAYRAAGGHFIVPVPEVRIA